MVSVSESRTTGALLVTGAALFWSSGGVLFRYIRGADEWTIAFWRALFLVIVLTAVLAVMERGRVLSAFMRVGWRGWASGVCFGVMMTGFMLALARTSVANTMLLMTAAPVFAALLGWAVLAERPRPMVWVAMAAAAGGIALMVATDLGGGAMIGNLFALIIAVAAAVNIVVLRGARNVNMIPAIIIGGLISGIVSLPLAGHTGVHALNLFLIFLLGVVQLGLGSILYIFGARHLPASETTLIAMLESVLSPLWVWLLLSEAPTAYGLAGGAIVFAAVVALTLSAARRRDQPAPQPAA